MKTVAGLMLALGLLASPLVLQDAAFGQSMDKGGRMMQGQQMMQERCGMTPGAMMRMMRTMMGNGIMGGGMMGTRGGSGMMQGGMMQGGMMQGGMMQGGMMQGGMMQSGMMQGGMMQGGMMGMGMAGGAGMILGLEESLDLSEDQVQRLEEMQESIRDEVQQHMSQAMEARQAAMEALQSDSPDLGSYEESLREAADHSILAHTAMARSDLEARQLLTAEQQKDLAYTRSMMMEMCRAATGSPRSGEGPG